jgi:hypothetical protein
LKSEIKEEVYLELPEGWELLLEGLQVDWTKGLSDLLEEFKSDNKIVKLLKTLYGLKQSGREWNETLHKYLVSQGLTRCNQDFCLYVRHGKDENMIIVGVYVDDILTTGNDGVEDFRRNLHNHF